MALRRIAALLVQVLVILAVTAALDLAGGLACSGRCDFVDNTEHRKKYRIRHPVYHHALAPDVTVMARWGNTTYPLSTNSLGFRDAAPRTVPKAPPAGWTRLLLLGDSFTEGQGVPWPDTLAGRLTRALAPRHETVLNGAVSSYATAIYLAKMRYLLEVEKLAVDRVVLLMDISDPLNDAGWYETTADGRVVDRDSPAVKESLPQRLGQWYKRTSLIARLVVRLRDNLHYAGLKAEYEARADHDGAPFDLALVEEKTTGIRDAVWTYDDEAWAAYGQKGRAIAKANLDQLKALLDARGIPFTLVVYPWPDQIFHDPQAPRQTDFWRAWAAANGTRFVNLFPLFTDGLSPEKALATYFIPYDVHWNAAGHGLVAKALLDALDSPSLDWEKPFSAVRK